MNKAALILVATTVTAFAVTYSFTHSLLLSAVLLFVLGSEVTNGYTDAPNAVAPLISTRAMAAGNALLMAAILNFVGTLMGTEVAETMGKGIVDPASINLVTIGSALVGLVMWSNLAAVFGIPTSESHALIAGLSGAALATAGPHALQWDGWKKALIGIFSALFLGYAITWLLGKAVVKLAAHRNATTCKKWFDRLQIVAGGSTAFAHGMNDGQKFMGVFALSLVMGGVYKEFHIPFWIKLLCAGVMGIGTFFGGKAIVGTLGEKIAKLEGWQGFSALTGSATTIVFASAVGVPLSTTHTIVSAITGAGVSRFPGAIQWRHPVRIGWASFLTFPFCGTIAYAICLMFQTIQKIFLF